MYFYVSICEVQKYVIQGYEDIAGFNFEQTNQIFFKFYGSYD